MALRKEALQLYKHLLRTRAMVFANDPIALEITRQKIREGYDKNRSLTEEKDIRKNIQNGYDVILVLKTEVVQAPINDRGNYEVKVRDEHLQSNS